MSCRWVATRCCQRQPRLHGQHAATRTMAWRANRLDPIVENIPGVLRHSFDVTNVVPERAIPTNPATADSLHLLRFHRGYCIEGKNRSLTFPADHPKDPQLPEGALYHNAAAFAGTMAAYIIGRTPLKMQDPALGSSYLLSPCVKAPGISGDSVYLGSASHNFTTYGLKYSVGASTEAVFDASKLVDMSASGKTFDSWDLTAEALAAIEDLVDVPPVPKSHPATLGYPALEVPAAAKLPVTDNSPAACIVRLQVEGDFPFTATHDWYPGVKQDWLVPAYIPPEEVIGSFVAVAGITGSSSNIKLLQDLYGVGDESEALVLAEKLSKVLLPARRLVVSPGDVIADNGLYMYHRASANCGMSGGAVRSLDHPQLLLGTHIGASGTYAFNIATSVNHPIWCGTYVQEVLPALMEVTDWPAPYMPGSLASYLTHHKEGLSRMGLWQQHAEPFVRRHGGPSASGQ